MPDYEYVYQKMQKSGVTLSHLWAECCEQCRANREIPYQSTQFNKYYSDFVHKTKATMHLEHKIGNTMQRDWVGQTGGIIHSDTGEVIPVYLFVSALPYSGYVYVEAYLYMKQEAWIKAHVHAYQYFGGVTSTGTGQPQDRCARMKRSLTRVRGKWQICGSLPALLRFSATAIAFPLIRGCIAGLTSIAQMRAICRRNTRNIYSVTEKDSSAGQSKLERVRKLLHDIFFPYIKSRTAGLQVLYGASQVI